MDWYDEETKPVEPYFPLQAVPEPRYSWAYLEDQCLISVPNEDQAVMLAETFPDTIYFFASNVQHPQS
jgi:hypothetical protein